MYAAATYTGSTYSIAVFYQNVVVTRNGDKEQDHLNIVKHMYPLLAL